VPLPLSGTVTRAPVHVGEARRRTANLPSNWYSTCEIRPLRELARLAGQRFGGAVGAGPDRAAAGDRRAPGGVARRRCRATARRQEPRRRPASARCSAGARCLSARHPAGGPAAGAALTQVPADAARPATARPPASAPPPAAGRPTRPPRPALRQRATCRSTDRCRIRPPPAARAVAGRAATRRRAEASPPVLRPRTRRGGHGSCVRAWAGSSACLCRRVGRCLRAATVTAPAGDGDRRTRQDREQSTARGVNITVTVPLISTYPSAWATRRIISAAGLAPAWRSPPTLPPPRRADPRRAPPLRRAGGAYAAPAVATIQARTSASSRHRS
jgi:hypothetical protein